MNTPPTHNPPHTRPPEEPDEPAGTDWRQAVAAYHDGEADAATRATVEALLARSPQARAYWAELRTLDGAVDRLAQAVPAPGRQVREQFWQRAAAAGLKLGAATPAAGTRPQPQPQRSRQRRVPVARRGAVAATALAAAAVVLLVMGLMWLVPPDTGPAVPPRTHAWGTWLGDSGAGSAAGPTTTHPPSGAPADAELLAVLDLLASDLDFAVLASLEEEDLEILSDLVYHEALESYDPWESH